MKNVENKSPWMIFTGMIAALGASACCIGPLILTMLGVSGAAALSKLEFLRLPLVAVVVATFGFAGYTLYKKRTQCEPGSICADPEKYRKLIILYWIGVILAVAAITSPYWVGHLF